MCEYFPYFFLFPHPVLHVAAIHENILAENNLAYTRYKFYGQRGLRCLLMLVINWRSYADSCPLIKVQRCGVLHVGAGEEVFWTKASATSNTHLHNFPTRGF